MDKVVERVTEGKGVMPSFKGQLNDVSDQQRGRVRLLVDGGLEDYREPLAQDDRDLRVVQRARAETVERPDEPDADVAGEPERLGAEPRPVHDHRL